MPKYVIERDYPGAGELTSDQLKQIALASCSALHSMGHRIEWIHSYVTTDKIYCVYRAADEEAIREHARIGGFPVTRISEVRSMIDPTTAGG